MENLSINEILFLISSILGAIGIFAWIGIGAFITSKWITEIEDILEDGPTLFSTGIVFGLQGVLHYGSIFLWSFHAKRYGMLEKREQVPKYIQRWYIFGFFWFMTSALLFFSSAALFYIYIE